MATKIDSKTGIPIHWYGEDGKDFLVSISGRLLVARRLQPPTESKPGSKRGKLTTFSRAARLRMLKTLAKTDLTTPRTTLFITLTYPTTEIVLTRKDLNIHKYKFFRYIEKHLGRNIPAIWRIEWIARKSGKHKGKFYPHIHIMLFTVRYIHYEKVNLYWRKAIGRKGYCRTETKGMKNEKQTIAYVAKYCAKEVEDCSLVNAANLNIPSGKDWGIHRRGIMPFCKETFYREPSGEVIQRLKHFLQHAVPGMKEWEGSFTLLGPIVEQAEKVVKAYFGLDDKRKLP